VESRGGHRPFSDGYRLGQNAQGLGCFDECSFEIRKRCSHTFSKGVDEVDRPLVSFTSRTLFGRTAKPEEVLYNANSITYGTTQPSEPARNSIDKAIKQVSSPSQSILPKRIEVAGNAVLDFFALVDYRLGKTGEQGEYRSEYSLEKPFDDFPDACKDLLDGLPQSFPVASEEVDEDTKQAEDHVQCPREDGFDPVPRGLEEGFEKFECPFDDGHDHVEPGPDDRHDVLDRRPHI